MMPKGIEIMKIYQFFANRIDLIKFPLFELAFISLDY